MNETHWCEDKSTLVEYLYGELEADSRRAFEGHLRTCIACAQELNGLEGVRRELNNWVPPEMQLGFTVVSASANGGPVSVNGHVPANGQPASGEHPSNGGHLSRGATVLRPSRWSVSAMPAWARAAAAVFLIGAGLGLANVQVRSDANGLSISTGWMRPAASATDRVVQGSGGQVREAQGLATTAGTSEAPASRLELAALEADLRRELQTIQASHTGASPASESRMSVDDQAVLRRVQSLIAESERRQEQEFARRLTQFTRETEMQRRADLVRLEQGFGRFEAQRGAQAVRQQQMLDYLYRVSTSKVP